MLKKLASTHVLFFSFLKIILLNSEKTVEFYSTSAFSYFNQPSQESTHQETDTHLLIITYDPYLDPDPNKLSLKIHKIIEKGEY